MKEKSPVTKEAEIRIAEQEERLQKIKDLCERLSKYGPFDSWPDIDWRDRDMIQSALALHMSVITLDVKRQKDAVKNGSEDGDLRSHGEKEILQGCLALLCEAADYFREYLDYYGVDPDADEECPLSIKMTYGHIVNRLLLWNTYHSGGTSTATKCRELGVKYSDSIDICEQEDEE